MNWKKKVLLSLMSAVLFVQSAVFAFAEDAAGSGDSTATNRPGFANWIPIIIYLVLIVAMFYFLIIRPQKKRRKEEENLKSSLILGQDVVTIGGICGKIVNIKDDVITIQTSIDNTLLDFKNWAIREVKKQETDEKPEEKEKK